MDTQKSDELDHARDEVSRLIIEIMSQHLSSFEMSDVPSLLSKFTISTLHSISNELTTATQSKDDESKYQVRLIRSILGSGNERYVLTALKSRDFFTKEAEIHQRITEAYVLNLGAIQVNRDMEDAFARTQFSNSKSSIRSNSLKSSYGYDADRHAGILKAQNLADSILLDQMIDLKVDYYRELETLRENMVIIEPALSPVIRAARIVYGKSTTIPDGSGLRPLLNAEMVIAIATYCGDSKNKEELFISLLSEREGFDMGMLEILEDDSSVALANGTL